MNVPDEPGPQAEERLRAVADARRRAAPELALHPATRRMLVDEARRHHARHPARQGGPWRMRWVWGLASTLALVVTLLVLRPVADWIKVRQMTKSTPAPAAHPTPGFERAKQAEVRLDTAQEAAPGTTPAPPAAVEPRADAASFGLAESPAHDVAGATSTALFLGAPVAVAAPAAGQRFQQVRAAGERTGRGATPRMFERFTLLTAGTALQLTDADGSVYRGELFPAPGAAGQARAGVPVDNEVSQLPFRVAGTNLTLRLPVVVTGVVAVAAPSPPRTTVAGRALGEPAASLAPVFLSLRGAAVIGGSNRVEILAAPPRAGAPPVE